MTILTSQWRVTPQPDLITEATVDAMVRLLDNTTCPKYARDAFTAWLQREETR